LHSAKVTGGAAPKSTLKKNYDFQELLTFSPRSKEKAVVLPNEPAEIDLLIGTDCISEGQNLQDCDYLINYDIHWNPVRIIQRFGRWTASAQPTPASNWSTTGQTFRSMSTSTSKSGLRAG
jgi:hypothetical protein